MKKNKIFLLILGILFIAILSLLFFQLRKITSPTTPTNQIAISADFFLSPDFNTITSFNEIEFTGTPIITPPQLATYNFTKEQSLATVELINKLCQINNSTTIAEDLIIYYGEFCNYYFPNEYIINLFPGNEETGFSLAELGSPAAESDFFLPFLDHLYQNNEAFLPLDNHDEKNSALPGFYTNNYSFVNYSYHINSIPISIRGINMGLFSFTFYKNAFQNISLPTFKFTFYEQEVFTTLSTQQALANIANGDAYLSAVQEYNYSVESDITYEDLTNISLENVALEYIVDEDKMTAIPSYRFFGTADDRKGNQFGVEIITPAINFTIAEPTPTPTTP